MVLSAAVLVLVLFIAALVAILAMAVWPHLDEPRNGAGDALEKRSEPERDDIDLAA
jgi:hypothetical protein